MDRCRPVGREIGDEIGHLLRLGPPSDRNPAQSIENCLSSIFDRTAVVAVLDGMRIGYFMDADVREDIAAGRLVRILEDWTPPLAPLCLYYFNRRNPSAAFQAFIALARDVATGRRRQPET